MNVGISGVTGFLGSAIAVRFISEGHRVFAFSRNDSDGQRTKAAIEEAAKGFNLTDIPWHQLEIVDFDLNNVDDVDANPLLDEIDIMWHYYKTKHFEIFLPTHTVPLIRKNKYKRKERKGKIFIYRRNILS